MGMGGEDQLWTVYLGHWEEQLVTWGCYPSHPSCLARVSVFYNPVGVIFAFLDTSFQP